MGEEQETNYAPDFYTADVEGLRKLTEKVYDAIAPGVAKNESFVFTVTPSNHGSPWVHGFRVGAADVVVSVLRDGTVDVTPENTPVALVSKPPKETRNYIDINGMWTALQGTEALRAIYNLNGASEEHDGGSFYDTPHFGVDMYVPGGRCDTIADTLFLCLVWGYLYSLPTEDNGKTVRINRASFLELSPAGTEIPAVMSKVEGATVLAGFEMLTRELQDRGVFTRNKTLNDMFGFKFKGF